MSRDRILIVEDEAIVAMNVEDRLTAMGYELAGRANSGEQALALAAQRHPDLVLMDIRLQGAVDGIAAAEEMRQRFHVPVIFLTAYAEDSTVDRAKHAEPYGYILKPFDDRELKSAIEIALYRHEAEQEIRRLNRLYDVLAQVNQIIVRSNSREELLPAVCRLVVERGAIGLAWIGWLDPATSRIVPVAHFGSSAEMLSQVNFYTDERPEGQGNPGRAMREGKPFYCNQCAAGSCLYPDEAPLTRFGFQSCASFPIWFQGQACGTLNLAGAEPGFFRDRELDLLEEVAHDISFALDKIEGDAQRKLAEDALHESEEQLRAMFELASIGIAQADPQTGRLMSVNKKMCEITGYSAGELLEKRFSDITFPEDRRADWEAFQRVICSETPDYRLEKRYVCKDGAIIWVNVNMTVIRDAAGQVTRTVAAVEDITERKISSEALRESEQRYRTLTEAAEDSIFIIDSADKISFINSAGARLLGRSAKDLVGRCRAERFPPSVVAVQNENLGRVIETGKSSIHEASVPTPSGEVWMSISLVPLKDMAGKTSGVLGIARNITERRQTEVSLRASENRLRLALSAAKMGVWEWNIETNSVFWSPECYEIAGAQGTNLTFDTFANSVHPEDAALVRAAVSRALVDRSAYAAEFRFIRSDGRVVWLSNLGKTDYDQSGKPLRMVGIVRDITGFKQAEDALRQSEIRYHKLFNEATEGIALTASSGEIVDCNQAFLGLTGYQRHEVIGKPQSMFELRYEVEQGVSGTFAQHWDKRRDEAFPASLITKSGVVKHVEIKANQLEIEGRQIVQGFFRDITEQQRYHHERETTVKLMRLLNDHNNTHELIRSLTGFIQEWIGCEAVGVRLQDGEDYPYSVTTGFPPEFVEAERYLCARDAHGRIERTCQGTALLECMCGNILCGRFNPDFPFFTSKGSFWTNSTTELLATTIEADRMACTRNRCNSEGYESVALFALRHGSETLGLLQVNDREKDLFTPELVSFLENAADQIAIALAQRQTQAALRESEESYRVLVENAAEVIGVSQGGMLRFVNSQAEAVSGYTREELTTRPFLEFVHPEDRPQIMLRQQRLPTGAPALSDYQVRIVRKDGEVRWLHAKATSIVWNKAPATLEIYNDVTKNLRAEEDREKLRSQLFQAQRMESVARLAGGVAHDFNNMLSVILGYVDSAMEQVDPSHPLYRNLSEIKNAGQHSAQLTRQLLGFARRQTVSPKMLDLNKTIEEMLNLLLQLIGENIHLVWNPGQALWNVRMDPSQIDQILANLAVNARDAISGVGQVTIETTNRVLDESYCARHIGAVPGEYAMIALSDNGSGMKKDVLEHAFEPFFTTKEIGKGTGLGLSTVYGIVSQNNGFIDVLSEPGKGTEIQIYLPRFESKADPTLRPAKTKIRGGKETILLVEDALPLLRLGEKMLADMGYTVLSASTPWQALDRTLKHVGDIHLLVTDVVMPEMNGHELAERLRELKPGIKCLYMSGYTTDVIASQGVLEEGLWFIQKPFNKQEFAARVRDVLDE